MLPKMRYRLGLDLGPTSIGWCLIRLDAEDHPIAVIRMGSRIFSDGRNPKDSSSLAVVRRNARQMRRRRDRLLKRKQRMLSALIALGFFPADETERRNLVTLDPYHLRKKGLDEPLTGPEFARALFHINQRRGFLSNRKTDKKENDSGILKEAIKELRGRLLAENCRTLGEWLAIRQKSGLSVRARLRGKTQKDKAYDFYADREMIADEFDTLWAKQRAFTPELFSDDARNELRDILLHQRALRPVKPGRCTLLPDDERAPRALPSTQQFRIFQEVNNLRILNPDFSEQSLSLKQRDRVVALLEPGKDAKLTGIRRELKLPTQTRFNLEDVKRDRLKGNTTSAVLSRPENFGDGWHDYSLSKQDAIVEMLLNEASESMLINWLVQNTDVDEVAAERIANSRLPEGYGNLSRAALSRVLPELVKDVITYSDAVSRAGFSSHSALSLAEQTGEVLDSLPYYGEPLQRHVALGTGNPDDPPETRFGKIANPTVHIGLNELRKVVNALIKRYGHPSQVVIELVRDLKLSRERKLDIQRDQKARQDRNQEFVIEACRVLGLTPDNLNRSKRRELSQKMQLWTELNPVDVANRRCPYTGEQISITRLLSNEVEIEHILPFSSTLDDSLNNKTVAMRRANRDKGNRTPYAAFGERPVPGYDYSAILERAALMPRAKAKRFGREGYEQWLRNDDDFLARALNDTAYLSRIAKEYLSLICPPNCARAIPGRMTAMLRGKFGLNQLLSGSEYKNRDDHRHHALDAAVVGVTDQGLLQRFSKASANAREKQLDRLVEEMPLPWTEFRAHVRRALSHITVSHKPDHGYQGAMHEETAWGFRDGGMVTRRIQLEDGEHRQRELKKKNLIPINSTRDDTRHGSDAEGRPSPYKGYVGGSNYCIEIWRGEKCKWHGDVISTFSAYQVIRTLGEAKGLEKLRDSATSQQGKPLVMRLFNNDLVRLDLKEESRTMRIVKISQNGQITMCDHNEANVNARNSDKEDEFSYVSKMAGSLQRAKGRRIVVSPTGIVRDPGYKV